MARTVRAVFDGEVLRPDQPIDLRPNTAYLVTIGPEVAAQGVLDEEPHPLTAIGRLAVDMGVTDLAINHDRYAHNRIEDEQSEA